MIRAGLLNRVATICMGAGIAHAQGHWVGVGSCPLSDEFGHETIAIRSTRNDFRILKIEVENAGVSFERIVVHYEDGLDQPVELRQQVRAGGQTGEIDLHSGRRVIKSVDLWYKYRSQSGRQAVVKILART